MKQNVQDRIQNFLHKEMDPAFARRASIIARELDITGKEHILEIGCGRGFYEEFLPFVYPDVHMTAIDRKEEYLSQARRHADSKRIHFQIDDAMKLSFTSNSFDRVLSTEVLEHLPDDVQALKEFHRVLKKKGTAIFTVPHANYPFLWDPLNWILEHTLHTHISKDIWWLAGIWADHVRLYTEDQLVSRCKEAGFEIENVWRATRYCIPFEHFLLYGIGKNLVERGMMKDVNRFNINAKPSPVVSFIRNITYMADGQNKDSEVKGVPVMNLIIKVKKK